MLANRTPHKYQQMIKTKLAEEITGSAKQL